MPGEVNRRQRWPVLMGGALCGLGLALSGAIAETQIRRVPVRPLQPMAEEAWRSGPPRANACIDSTRIAGAVVMDQRTVDIILRGGQRYRLHLASDCAQLGYYGGLYYQPERPGLMCAGKDRIMGRAGGACRVKSISSLVRDAK